MRSFIVLLFALLGMALCVPSSDLVAEEWENYKLKYNKAYENDVEEKSRMEIFMENRNMIAKHNAEYEMGLVSFQMELNNFSDWFPHELEPMMNCFNYRQAKLYREKNADKVSTFLMPAHVTLPDQVDWRAKGAVTPVKNQGNCGSCYAFSSTGALEGAYFRNTSKLVSLSEQQLVDCSSKYDNLGCNGGLMNSSFAYIKENGGIASESSYPYKAVEETCHYNPSDMAATVSGYHFVKEGDEEALKAAVAAIGPVSVAIDCDYAFHHYRNGVHYDPNCASDLESLSHAVLVVGYGTEDGKDYWLVKNSWGTIYGDKGYIKMARNRGNNCGIATFAIFPVV